MTKRLKYSLATSTTAMIAGICNYLVFSGKVQGILLIVLLITGVVVSLVTIALLIAVFTKNPDKTMRKIFNALFDLTFLYP